MQFLPTPVCAAELTAILNVIKNLPTAQVDWLAASAVSVTAIKKSTGKREKVLTALSADGNSWFVKAVPGLITAK